jgi:general stress protein CsbA
MHSENQHLEALQDIRQMMQRSSRFLSLSGLSGIAAGVLALAGAFIAHRMIDKFYAEYNSVNGYSGENFRELKLHLFLLSVAVLGLSLLSAFYFTWRKTRTDQTTLWNRTSRQLAISLLIPLVAGGLFVLSMLQHNEWRFVAPGCLLFYGIALINAGKYTLRDIHYLGITEIILGLIATQYLGYGLYFWAIGFGVLHIIYGFIMWWKYERKSGV